MLMRVAHYPGHAWQGGNLLRSALGIAARDYNFCRWIFAMDTANGGACVLVCSGGDGTGIQHHQIGFLRRTCLGQALGDQLALQGCSIRLSGAAAKTLDKESGHEGYYNGTTEGTIRCSSSQPIQLLAASY